MSKVKRFKFQTFSERVSNLDIRKKALYYIEHKNEAINSENSYFFETLQKWRALNLTQEFSQLDQNLGEIQTLAQLIHRKNFVGEYLVNAFERTTKDSLQALLELISAAARDLVEGFYEFFRDVFAHLSKLLFTNNGDELEWTLTCIAQLFKILKKSIKRDFTNVFHQILPLLSTGDHITNFIAECFAFVTRELGKREDFISFVIENINKEHVTGCGRLFFEMLRGVSGAFHLDAKPILQALYSVFLQNSKNQDILFEILVQITTDIVDLIDKKHVPVYTEILQTQIMSASKMDNFQTLNKLLQLLGQIVEGLKAKLQPNTEMIVECIFKIFDLDVNDDTLALLSQIVTALILIKPLMVTQLTCTRLCKKVMSIRNCKIVQEFVVATLSFDEFDSMIMPEFMKYFTKNLNSEMLQVFANILISKECIWFDGSNIKQGSSQIYQNEQILDYLKKVTLECKTNHVSDVSATHLLAIMCLPHLSQSNAVLSHLRSLKFEENSSMSNKTLIALFFIVQSRIKCGDNELSDLLPLIDDLTKVEDSSNLLALRLLDLCVTAVKMNEITDFNEQQVEHLNEFLGDCLLSPITEVRVLATHSLVTLNDSNDMDNVYKLMSQMETLKIDVFNYREHIMLCDKFRLSSLFMKNQESLSVRTNVLKYLVGTLYKNFKLIWDPTTEIIVEYSKSLPITVFWSIFEKQLETVTNEKSMEQDAYKNVLPESCPVIDEFIQNLTSFESGADAVNYRLLLWNALAKMPSVCESKNRDIVAFYLKFYNHEYLAQEIQEITNDVEDVDEEEGTIIETANKKGSRKQKLLKAHLTIFSILPNPSQVYKSTELSSTFKQLLTHRSFEISGLALKCLVRCKCTYFKNISDDLVQLIEDKAFKGGVSLFNVEQIKSIEHRDELIEIIMKIIHMKLLVRPTKNARISYLAHKRQIIEFLKRFTATDICTFLNTIFKSLMDDDKQFSSKFILWNLQMVNLIVVELSGHINSDGMRHILNVLFKIGKLESEQAEVRSKLYNSLCNFYEHFEQFEWTPELIDEVFKLFVWPKLENLPNDSANACSGLLKLMIEWSKTGSYFNLLNKSGPNGIETPIHYVIKLLTNANTSNEVKEEMYLLIIRITQESSEGVEIISPFVSKIIEVIGGDLQNGKINLEKVDILELLQLSHKDKHEDEISNLLKILFTLLHKFTSSKKAVDNEKVGSILNLLQGSVHSIDNKESYIKKIAPFFDKITGLDERRLLCKAAKNILNSNNECQQIYNIVEHFNALDRRWTDQPDYRRRLEAFDLISTTIPDLSSCPVGVVDLIFYSCFHILSTDKDIAMRDQAYKHLCLTCDALLNNSDPISLSQSLDTTILSTITTKLKERDSRCRSECIQLLGELSKKYSDKHFVFKDLSQLTHNKDADQDFFENMTHLQEEVQRRAIIRYTKLVQNNEFELNQRTIVNFILPIIAHYTCNEQFAKKSKVTEIVITAISTTAGHLNWNNYETLLKYYLTKLSREARYQKQLINICVGILNSFHFKEECKIDPTKTTEADDETKENRILKSIMKNIVPNLLNSINTHTKIVGIGNADKRREKYEEDRQNVLKLSLALALVKLLQKLPKFILDQHLTSIIYKVSNFLKSSSKAVRIMSRDILRKILTALGSTYLEQMLLHLSSTLSRGNEIHVLTVTTNCLLEVVKSTLKPAHVDAILQIVLRTCLSDIFRTADGYRKGMRLMNRRNEAKPSKKSYLSLGILASGISENCILDLVVPIKDVLTKVTSHSDLQKVQECLDNIVAGLCKNSNITKEGLLTFLYGILNDNISQLIIDSKKEAGEVMETEEKSKIQIIDSLIVPPEPKRRGALNHTVARWKCDTNAYMLTQFAFQILHILLKRKLVLNTQLKEYVDAIIPLLAKSLDAEEIKIKIFSLKCITCIWKAQYKSDVLNKIEPVVVKKIFKIIQTFIEKSIARKEENMQLIRSSFKALVSFIKNVKAGRIKAKQIELMLAYVDNELGNPDTKSMAYPLFRTILEKKLQSKTINKIAKKVANICLQSEFESIRHESRTIVLSHIKNYPSKLNQDYYMKFFCKNLQTNTSQIVKTSSIQMLSQMLKLVDQEVMKTHWKLLLKTLAFVVVNETIEEIKMKSSDCLEFLVQKLDAKTFEEIFTMLETEFGSIWPKQKRFAICVSVNLLKGKKDMFMEKLDLIISNLLICLIPKPIPDVPGKFVKLSHLYDENGKKIKINSDRIHSQITDALNAFLNILETIPDLSNYEYVKSLMIATTSLLESESFMIRKKSVEVIEKICAKTDKKLFQMATQQNVELDRFPFTCPVDNLIQITEKLCTELETEESNVEHIRKIFDVLFVLAQPFIDFDPNMNEFKKDTFDLYFLCKKLSKINYSGEEYHSTVVKRHLYEWMEKLIHLLKPEAIMIMNQSLTIILVKDMIESEGDSNEVKDAAIKVWNLMQKRLDGFQMLWSKVQNIYNSIRLGVDKKRKSLLKRKRKSFSKGPDMKKRLKV